MTPDRVAAVELRDVHFSYPGAEAHDPPALAGLSLTVAPGERVAVLGPNGAGKSTLCLHLNGILQPDRGTVRAGGLAVGGHGADPRDLVEVRRRVGLVFQDPDDMLFLPTVAEDVAFGPVNLGLPPDEVRRRVDEALATVGLEAVRERAPHHLSYGQRRRAAIAAVLSMRPEVLVLDEPSANLDPRGRRELGELLDRLDLTLLLVTHDLPYAAQRCDRAVVLDRGVVAADGPAGEILGDDALLAAHDLELPAGYTLPQRAGAPRT